MDDFWGRGNYEAIAALISAQGRELVAAAGVRPGQRVLDVAAGVGAAAAHAAEAGAEVVASDTSPALLERGRARLSTVDWVFADAADLPFADGEFDVVLSAIGAMFAPDQEATARELLRVCRPGGTIAMANWTPDGAAGRFIRVLGRHLPPPPPGPAPTAWGDPDRVRALLGPGLSTLDMEDRVVPLEFAGGPEELAELYLTSFPPVVAAAEHDAAGVRADLVEFFSALHGGYDWLLVRGVRRA